MEQIFKTIIILFSIEACVSSKNNTTIYICVGENVTVSCPSAGINKTVTWFRRNKSKNPITRLYAGSKGKDTNLPSNTAVNVNKEKGEFNLTIMNLTKADNGTYQCLHDKDLTSWLFHIIIKDQGNSNTTNCSWNQQYCEDTTCLRYVSEETTVESLSDGGPNMMWWYVMCCGLVAVGLAILSCKNSKLQKGRKAGSRPRKVDIK
ncbi:Hypothetical predicted protein [Mytilus galloprovincialis]|uniref:Ig-like domain-containing protein n=1 Tax=Mytilus galloprovincialis TaxID=29158 RepID=A0A8B6C9H0_MYTGA|nr:Hypothetical predicted protein [Mytilus galloprovincialis]